jgi:trk system potassium uptake protein TrkH
MNRRGLKFGTRVDPRWLGILLKLVLAATGLAAVAALVLEYGGFQLTARQLQLLHGTQVAIVAVFALDRMLRLVLVRSWRDYLHENAIDLALVVLVLAGLALSYRVRVKILSAGTLYVLITQGYILVMLLLHAATANLQVAGSGIGPGWLMLVSFSLLCLIGAGLLMLPVATPPDRPINFVDALFTSTSATCVTGLVVRDTGAGFTPFGQAVILVLIQTGGLGIMLFGTMLAVMVGRSLSMRTTSVLNEMTSTSTLAAGRIVGFIVVCTLALEAAGAALLYPMFHQTLGPTGPVSAGRAVWLSAFHSVAAFCNAGFSLYGDNLMQGVQQKWAQPLRSHWQVLGVLGSLIVLGGLGFPVLMDLSKYLIAKARRLGAWMLDRPRPARFLLPLHSKLVIFVSAALIVGGAAGILLLEPPNTLRYGAIGRNPLWVGQTRQRYDWTSLTVPGRIREATFMSISARTAGFNTVDLGEFSGQSKAWIAMLMVIGGSPAGTAGGAKTVTFAILVLAAWSVLMRRQELEVWHRSLPMESLRRASALMLLYVGVLVVVTLGLGLAMPRGHDFIDLFFEAASALGTVGLSANVTPTLSTAGRIIITAAMFVGRLGPLTLLLGLTTRLRHVEYAYPREGVFLG